MASGEGGKKKKKRKHTITKTLHPQPPGCISKHASSTGPPSKSPFLWEEESIPNTEKIQPKAASELSQAARGTGALIHSGVHTRTLTLGTVVRVTKLLCRCKGREFPATSAEIQTGMLPLCHKNQSFSILSLFLLKDAAGGVRPVSQSRKGAV